MALKVWNYNTPSEYSYDSAKIEVTGGLAKLVLKPFITSDIYACWHINESSGTNVPESVNSRNGTTVNSPSWVAGKLNNCLQFSSAGSIQYVNCGDIANFERTTPWSFECWFKTDVSGVAILASRQVSNVGWQIYSNGGQINVYFGNSYPDYYIHRTTTGAGVHNNAWHHLIVTYTGSSLASGVTIYLDGAERSSTIGKDTLSLSMLVSANLYLGARADLVYKFNGSIDEAIIYTRVLTPSEVTYRYNSGTGREDAYSTLHYDDTKPYIQPTSLFHSDFTAAYYHWLEALGGGNAGSIRYVLSHDGSDWYYWNGSAWITGGSATNSNTVAEVEAHIGDFSITDDITYRAYLISDGSQAVELDDNTIDYLANQAPLVNAGVDKSCSDHSTISPFSDAVISDPDGEIENATAHYYIEGSGWVEITKGALTLQNAIRAVTFTFDNLGDVTCQLRVTDELGTSTTDSLIVTVAEFEVTFNIKDEQGFDIPSLVVNFGDGTPAQLKSSPFNYSYEYDIYSVTIDKFGYSVLNISLDPQTTPIVNAVMTFVGTATWDVLASEHTIAGSFGKLLKDIEKKVDDNQALIIGT
jgi:hypothetical protein